MLRILVCVCSIFRLKQHTWENMAPKKLAFPVLEIPQVQLQCRYCNEWYCPEAAVTQSGKLVCPHCNTPQCIKARLIDHDGEPWHGSSGSKKRKT